MCVTSDLSHKCIQRGFAEPQISGKADRILRAAAEEVNLAFECFCETNGIFLFRFLKQFYFRGEFLSLLITLNSALTFMLCPGIFPPRWSKDQKKMGRTLVLL